MKRNGGNRLTLDAYKALLLDDVENLRGEVCSLSELPRVLNDKWFQRLRTAVTGMGEDLKYEDAAFHMFRCFRDCIDPGRLDSTLSHLCRVAKEGKKLRSYRKSLGELGSRSENQIIGSLFELITVSGLVSTKARVEVFPRIKKEGSDVDASVTLENRRIYIEAKALGYSRYDPKARFGCIPFSRMVRQIKDALDEKLRSQKQLDLISRSSPAVLLLSLGYLADYHACQWMINEHFTNSGDNVACVIVFGSYLCRQDMVLYHNQGSTMRLNKKERGFFEGSFRKAVIGSVVR